MNTHQKGDWGEQKAVDYLVAQGYSIVCRKYRCRRGEIDCVVREPDGTVVFVEVKSAQSSFYGNPLSWVTASKQRTLARVALQYLAEHHLLGFPCRFDVIAITKEKIDHLRNAFLVSS